MSRRQEIDNVLTGLARFKQDPAYADQAKQYAIEANIAFLEAARSLPSYLRWLFRVAPKLEGSKLLELTDFPVPEWDIAMHERLIAMQRRKRPGLITPLVDAITSYIKEGNRDLILADLGAGGMEVDRQVAKWAVTNNTQHTLTIVGVDKSPVTRRIADKNLGELSDDVEIVETLELTASKLTQIRAETTKKVLIVLCTNDIFDLDKKFGAQYFDLVYHSLFRHHLTLAQQADLDRVIESIAKKHLEFDGYKSWSVVIPQTIVGWNQPHFLNGEIFSNLRFRNKSEILIYTQKRGVINFYASTGFYLLEYYS